MENHLKIYGTIGPSCNTQADLQAMLEAGMTGLRLNLSHTSLKNAQSWLEEWHKAQEALGIQADLLIDLQGRELRIKDMENLILEEGDHCILGEQIPLDQEVMDALEMGDILLLDDGKIKLQVLSSQENGILCAVLQGGMLTSRKSIKIENKEIPLPPVRAEDIYNLSFAREMGVTGIMVPFVRRKEDLIAIHQILKQMNLPLKVFAKIENQEGADNLEELADWCDEIVIARGDLGNSISLEKLPWLQRDLEIRCRKINKPYMIVTQMLESMRQNAAPTRAEVNDVFWAVYDGAASIMLTGETAFGLYPVKAMEFFTAAAKEALSHKQDVKTEAA